MTMACCRRGRARRELALEDERLEIGVVEEVAELVLDVAVVDVDPHGADLENRPQRLDPLDGVVGVDADVVVRAEAVRRQVVRQAVGSLFHLAVGAPLALADEVLSLSEAVRRVLEQVRQIEFHARR
jgi:hypothetical protein